MPMEKVLVTGGAGFIGSRLATRLCQEGIDVVVADVLHPQVHAGGRPGALPEAATLFPLDVTYGPTWDALFQLIEPDTVVHLAAETGTGQSLLEASRHGAVNVVGTTQLLDAMARSGHIPDHVVLSSSRAVYGEGEWESDGHRFYPPQRTHADLEAKEWDPRSPSGGVAHALPSVAGATRTEPINVYGATKLAQEHILKAWGGALGSSVSILRFQNVYGVGQSLTNPYTGVLSLFAQMALRGEALPVYEDGSIIRDFVYVDDVVDALVGHPRIAPRHHSIARHRLRVESDNPRCGLLTGRAGSCTEPCHHGSVSRRRRSRRMLRDRRRARRIGLPAPMESGGGLGGPHRLGSK